MQLRTHHPKYDPDDVCNQVDLTNLGTLQGEYSTTMPCDL
jgi:hypothetical protein